MTKIDVTIIQNLVNQIKISNVKRAIEVGKELTRIKATLNRGEWIPFIESSVGLSKRTCQNYMFLYNQPIQEKHYIHGTEEIMKMIREGHDLSV